MVFEIERSSLRRQLSIWRGNLAQLEEQRAMHGVNVPLAIVNAIEEARKEITRLEQALAAGEPIDVADSYDSLVGLFGQINEELVRVRVRVAENEAAIKFLRRRLDPSARQRVSRIAAMLLGFGLLYSWALFEVRSFYLNPANRVTAIVLTGTVIGLGALIYWLGTDDEQ